MPPLPYFVRLSGVCKAHTVLHLLYNKVADSYTGNLDSPAFGTAQISTVVIPTTRESVRVVDLPSTVGGTVVAFLRLYASCHGTDQQLGRDHFIVVQSPFMSQNIYSILIKKREERGRDPRFLEGEAGRFVMEDPTNEKQGTWNKLRSGLLDSRSANTIYVVLWAPALSGSDDLRGSSDYVPQFLGSIHVADFAPARHPVAQALITESK